MKASLTKANLEKYRPSDSTRIMLWDTALPCFGARIGSSGRATYILHCVINGRVRRPRIGTYPAMTPEVARKKARELLVRIQLGEDPLREEAPLPTVDDLLDSYLTHHAAIHCKPSTLDEYRSLRHRHFGKWGKRRVDEITKKTISDYHYDLRETPREANAAIVLWRAAWNWACGHYDGLDRLIDPSRRIRLYPRRKRTRFLTDTEVPRIGQAIEDLMREGDISLSAGYAIQMILLTGMRSSEVTGLKHEYIDYARGEIRLPDSKTGPKVVQLTSHSRALLEAIVPSKNNPFVFPGRCVGRGFRDLQKPWTRICTRAGISGIRIHDLRHTFASQVDETQKKAMADALGHATLTVTDGYRHSSPEAVRQTAENAATRLAGLLSRSVTN